MAPEAITSAVRERLADCVRAWAYDWNEDHPRDVHVVVSTHDRAMRALFGRRVGSVDAPAYLVVLSGEFSDIQPGSGTVRSGVWAALFIDPAPMRVRSFTVRPPDMVPHYDLTELGSVYRLTV